MFKCQFCNKELTTKQNLQIHQAKTKYCLDKQNVLIVDLPDSKNECSYCKKEHRTNNSRIKHEIDCPVKCVTQRYETIIENKNQEIEKQKRRYETNLEIQKQHYETILSEYKKSTEILIEKERDKREKEIYTELYNKEHLFAQEQSKRLIEKVGTTTTTTHIKAKNITMNSLNLSQERLESIKDTYTIKHYERGGIGQADWVLDNVIRDESGNLIYKCTDKNRKNFIYHDDKGNVVNDIQAKRLKEAILPIMSTKLKEFKKIKCAELAEISDDESELLEKYSDLYNENKGMGNEFDKRLVEKTYV
ncbi:MAG: hypothetical protein PHG66_00820 [Candidatus Colwellbacteria bacterium]|nr:hypothetical protein [Candidatus Colwellbacteria bacterium]